MEEDSGSEHADVGAGRYRGFSSELQTPEDLLDKLCHDLERMETDPSSSCAAFDFFVTAEHMGEWCEDPDLCHGGHRKESDLLLVCDIANNAKHFIRHRAPNTSLNGVVVSGGAFSPAFQPDAFQVARIYVVNDEGHDMEALPLARSVLAFWQRRLAACP